MLKRMWKHELCLQCLTTMALAILAQALPLGSLNPTCVKNPPTHTKVGGHGGRQTTGGGPSGVQGGRGKVAQATGGHPGGEGNPLNRPGGSGRIGIRHGGRPGGSLPQRRLGRMVPGRGENGFNAQTSAFTAMRLLQAVRVAANLVRGGNQGDRPAGQAGPTKAPLEVLCDRRQLEDAYVATHGTPKPRLEFQGGDGYLKKQWRLIAKGELGYIPAKHIVSALPEEGERLIHPQEDHGGRMGQGG